MRLFKKTLLFLCIVSVLICAFASCEAKESLRLSADKTTAKHGEVVIFNTVHVTKKGEATADSATYEITSGSEYATLDGNKLKISEDAKNGAVITVVAKMGKLESNAVSITVSIPENSISISADKTVAQRGEIVNVTVTLTEDGKAIDAANATLTITKGSEFAKLVGTKLTINEDTANGSEIELTATYKNLTSNTIKITVSVPVTGITVSASKAAIPAGSFVTLQKVLTPAGAVGTIEWIVTEGADLCAVSGDILVVNDNATDGATIKVKAKCGNVESNELIFTVGSVEENFFLSISGNKLTVDRNGDSAALLEAEVLNSKLEVVDRPVSFEIISGAEFLSLNTNDTVCTFNALGHGDAVVRVSIDGTNVSKTVSVKVIVPPEAVQLPDMFVERVGHTYSFSMVNPGTGLADRLPFDANILGTNVCTNLKYTFVHADGTTGEDVAVWADGKITFKKQGRVTLTVSSDSGSRNEVTNTYSFNVNAGYNVYNYQELKSLLESDSYNGEIVNIVVTEKLTGANGYEYGYDLVPPAALKVAEEQTWANVLQESMIYAKNKNVYINGNLHKIDGSQLRVVSKAEIDSLNNQGYSFDYIYALLAIVPEASDAMQIAGRQHSVKIFDFEVVGNTPIDFNSDNLNGYRPLGSYNAGLCIGNIYYDVVYHVEMSNVTASRCNVGLRFRHTVGDSTFDNITVYNCFSNGIELEACNITFGDLTFGKCGAAGLEMVPSNSDRAGDTMNQTQKITFAGVIDTSANLSKGDSTYFQNYGAAGYTVPQILQGILQQYPASSMAHMMNANGEFGFVTFIFHDFATGTINKSEALYPAYQTSGGIINAKDLPVDGTLDTTHEYILLEVKISDSLNLGYALLYNHNYVAK